MKQIRRAFVLGLLTSVASVVFIATETGESGGEQRRVAERWTIHRARNFTPFPLFALGQTYDGFPLRAVYRRLDAPNPHSPVRANFVSFIYGSCKPTSIGCASPVEVQVWAACERNPSVYGFSARDDLVERMTIRGVPTIFYESGNRLELSSGTSTIVIFAERDYATEIANDLQGVNVDVPRRELLPPPAEGAVEGRLRCPYHR